MKNSLFVSISNVDMEMNDDNDVPMSPMAILMMMMMVLVIMMMVVVVMVVDVF